jgi:hypothetical protein
MTLDEVSDLQRYWLEVPPMAAVVRVFAGVETKTEAPRSSGAISDFVHKDMTEQEVAAAMREKAVFAESFVAAFGKGNRP